MKVNNKLVLNGSLSILIALGLTACGGGKTDDEVFGITSNEGDSGSSTDTGSGSVSGDDTSTTTGTSSGSGGSSGTSGSGNCVNIARHTVGEKATIRNVVTLDGNSAETDVTTEYTAVSDTSFTYKSTVGIDLGIEIPDIDIDLSDFNPLPDFGNPLNGDQEQTSETTSSFTISDNFMHINKEVTTQPVLGKTTVTYSPARMVPIDKLCEGQTWNQTYTSITTGGGASLSLERVQISVTNTVEAINVSASSPAGTFNTAQVKATQNGLFTLNANNISITSWVDVESGVLVKMETRNGNGDLIGTASLLSK